MTGDPIPVRATGELVRLRGWKDIARRLGVDERTVKRWEETRGLPVHRVPGEARAPVYAYESELVAWLKAGRGAAPGEAADPPAAIEAAAVPAPRRPVTLALLAGAVVLLGVGGLIGWQRFADARQTAATRLEAVQSLAASQVAAMNERLEAEPGTLALRARLVAEAVAVLGRVSGEGNAAPTLRMQTAEAWARLAELQWSRDRPSLSDPVAAGRSLRQAAGLLEGLPGEAARWARARVAVARAELMAAQGASADAAGQVALLRAAGDLPATLAGRAALAEAGLAIWRGDDQAALRLATPVARARPAGSEGPLVQLKAQELVAEAHYYGGRGDAALAGYRAAAALAAACAATEADVRWRWALLRQQWNVGSTLLALERPGEAVAPLRASVVGWERLLAADADDGAVARWVMVTRLDLGQALVRDGQGAAGVAALRASVAARRAWLRRHPDSVEAARGLVTGIAALGDGLVLTGAKGEACASFDEAATVAGDLRRVRRLTVLDERTMVKMLDESRRRHCA
ncbi:MerR family transcriptional regulator [Sandaracinobacteroides saxicola]|uniref:Uncharacterized protein n=1 Tax=Sandaracinobacteroides saxicola TaxID=2759707 RepID=A0A7G5IDP8_9SPHN|nr:hypothetical protein [Sandaracinobacteroides saxicola]QMW21490.1 hypothetical protein H3309_08605 [Sandaracinobacteroides saxicola]